MSCFYYTDFTKSYIIEVREEVMWVENLIRAIAILLAMCISDIQFGKHRPHAIKTWRNY